MYNYWNIILYFYIFLTNDRNQLLKTFMFVVFGRVDPFCAIDKQLICDVLYTVLTNNEEINPLLLYSYASATTYYD